jgi:hypothetical protein
MNQVHLEKLRYPLGRYHFNPNAGDAEVKKWIRDIQNLPKNLKKSVKGLNNKKLDTPYCEGGWTVRQVVHHPADSHINAYCRVKLAFTENIPVIKPFDENAWAMLSDSNGPHRNFPFDTGRPTRTIGAASENFFCRRFQPNIFSSRTQKRNLAEGTHCSLFMA